MAPVQARLAHARSNDYALVLSWTIGIAAVLLLVVTLAGREAKGAELRVE
jgi:hypothetical protein